MSRGFGSTFGAGTTDSIKTNYSKALAVQSTTACWVYVNAIGGGTFGRIYNQFVGGGSGTQLPALEIDASTILMADAAPFSGSVASQAQWTWPIPGAGQWIHVCRVHDASSTSNTPIVYVNGSPVVVTNIVPALGTFNPQTGPVYVGNRQDGIRNFDGMLAHFAIWQGSLLTQADALSMTAGISPIFIRPETLGIYLPLDGVNNQEFDYVNTLTSSITGTRVGRSNPYDMIAPFKTERSFYNYDARSAAFLAAWAASRNSVSPYGVAC